MDRILRQHISEIRKFGVRKVETDVEIGRLLGLTQRRFEEISTGRERVVDGQSWEQFLDAHIGFSLNQSSRLQRVYAFSLERAGRFQKFAGLGFRSSTLAVLHGMPDHYLDSIQSLALSRGRPLGAPECEQLLLQWNSETSPQVPRGPRRYRPGAMPMPSAEATCTVVNALLEHGDAIDAEIDERRTADARQFRISIRRLCKRWSHFVTLTERKNGGYSIDLVERLEAIDVILAEIAAPPPAPRLVAAE